MDRRTFFRVAGVGGLAALVPARLSAANEPRGAGESAVSLADTLAKAAHREEGGADAATSEPTCTLTPQETAGPYPLDLSATASMFRKNIAEGKSGIPLKLTLTVIDVNKGCAPVPDARVDLWHCDKDGYYSGYANTGYLGTRSAVGETFCRGIQLTDAHGKVGFETIYPGWYSGRVQHIHFQVFLNSVLSATSQLAFPETFNTQVNHTALYAAHGQNPTKNTNDTVFSDGANTGYQTVALAWESDGLEASLTVALAVPSTGVIRLTPETGGQFRLGEARVDAFGSGVEFPLWLASVSDVRLDIHDLQGRRLVRVEERGVGAGRRVFRVEKAGHGMALSPGCYVYQVTVDNEAGTFRQARSLALE